mgnify:CR=1
MRIVMAYLIVPIMYMTGFRFSKAYRHGISWRHRLVYRLVDTVRANRLAG